MADRVGEQLGTYRLIRLLGQGGFAEVYLGEHIHLGTSAAIKILKAQVASEDIEPFRREARLIANLKHPNIVPVLNFDVQAGTPFLVMDYAPNGTLRQRYPSGTPLPLEQIISYVKQASAALQYAHDRKVIHRDIKPENMLLGPNNEIWLSDFGIALIAQTTRAANAQDIVGTFVYMAPEVMQGHPSAASDQYALAVVVYQWLSGTPPFTGAPTELMAQHMHATPPSLLQRLPTLAPDIEMVVFKGLAKNPQQRFASVQEFAANLELAGQETRRVAPPPQQPPMIETTLLGPTGRIVLGPRVVGIGRLPDNQLVLNDTQVSWRHAQMQPQGQSHSITDVGSSNGTFVNGQQLTAGIPRLLNTGDTIRIGSTTLTYDVRSAPQTEYFTPVPPPPPPPWKPQLPPTRVTVTIALVAILVLGGIIVAFQHFRPQPVIHVTSAYHVGSTPAGSTGTIFHVSGQQFSGNSSITFLLDGTPAPGNESGGSDASGNVNFTLAVTANWTLGHHTLTAKDANNNLTGSSVTVEIVHQGEANTPGPNGAPPDDMSFSLNVSVQPNHFNSFTEKLKIIGHSDPTGGIACQDIDNGQQQTYKGTLNDGSTYTQIFTLSCIGHYKGGKLSYIETAISNQIDFSNGLSCMFQTPYVMEHLEGTFSSPNAIRGTFTSDPTTENCNQGNPQVFTADNGSWSGQLI